jgi:hypothetical protein
MWWWGVSLSRFCIYPCLSMIYFYSFPSSYVVWALGECKGFNPFSYRQMASRFMFFVFKVIYCVLWYCQIGIKTSKWFVVHYILVELQLEARFDSFFCVALLSNEILRAYLLMYCVLCFCWITSFFASMSCIAFFWIISLFHFYVVHHALVKS